ncbi:hypothetical protein ACFX12_010167 [Malus domestica]
MHPDLDVGKNQQPTTSRFNLSVPDASGSGPHIKHSETRFNLVVLHIIVVDGWDGKPEEGQNNGGTGVNKLVKQPALLRVDGPKGNCWPEDGWPQDGRPEGGWHKLPKKLLVRSADLDPAEQVEAAAQSSENAIQRILNPHQPPPSSIPPLLTSPTSPPSGSSPTLGQSSENELRLQLQILEMQEVPGL